VLDVAADAGGHAVEFAVQPALERRGPVVVEQAEVVQDLGGAFDSQPAAAQHRRQLRQVDRVAGGVAGQRDDQGAVDLLGQPVAPAVGLAEGAGSVAGLRQGGVGQVGVPVSVEARVVAADIGRQPQLHPAGQVRSLLGRLGLGAGAGAGRSSSLLAQQRAGLADAVHTEEEQLEEQLLAAHLAKILRPDAAAAKGPGLEPGLQPAQPAGALLDGDGPSAAGAWTGLVRPVKGRARSAAAPGQHTPGKAAVAAGGRLVRPDPRLRHASHRCVTPDRIQP